MTDQNSSTNKSTDQKGEGNIWAGIGIGIMIYIVSYFVGSIIYQQILFLIAGPIIHLIAIVIFFTKGKKYTGIGLLIFAGIIILLVSACFGFIIFQLNKGN